MSRLNVVLVGLLGVQLLLAVGLTMGRESMSIARSEEVFPDFDPTQVDQIEIVGSTGVPGAADPPGRLTLTRQGGTWQLEPSKYPVDESKVSELLDEIARLTARGPVVEKSHHHRSLEVADDYFQREVVLKSGQQEIGFYLGKSGGGRDIHLRPRGSDEVVRVAGLNVWDVSEQMGQWLDRSYVSVPREEVWSIRVENAQGVIRLERGEGTEFRLADQAPDEQVDQAEIRSLVTKASTLSLEEPVGRDVRPEYGLDAPSARVVLQTGPAGEEGGRPEETMEISFVIGAPTEDGARFYAQASSSDFVVEAAEWAVKPLIEKDRQDLLQLEDDEIDPEVGTE